MSTYDVVIAIPRTGRTFENFMNQLIKLGIEVDKIKLIVEAVRNGKKNKSYSPKLAQEYVSKFKEVSDNLSVFVDRKREDRPYRVGFIGLDIKLDGLAVRLEGDEPHNCSSLISLGEADIALAGFDELLVVTHSSISKEEESIRINKWGMYNYNIPNHNKVKIAGSAMLTRWNDYAKKEIQDIVGFFLISKKKPKENGKFYYPKDYLEHLERHGNKVYVKGRYADIIRSTYPFLNIEPVHDVEDAVEYSDGGIGIEIVQTGSTLRRKNLVVLGAPLFLSESLFVVDYYRFIESKNNALDKVLNILNPKDYYSTERIEQFKFWYSALEGNLKDHWINKPDINELFCSKQDIENGLRPIRLQTRYWKPSDTYKRDEAEMLIKKSRERLYVLYNSSK